MSASLAKKITPWTISPVDLLRKSLIASKLTLSYLKPSVSARPGVSIILSGGIVWLPWKKYSDTNLVCELV